MNITIYEHVISSFLATNPSKMPKPLSLKLSLFLLCVTVTFTQAQDRADLISLKRKSDQC